MKKILAVAAMAAMVAGAAFAADVSAQVQLDGDLFNVGTDGKVKALALKEYDPQGDSDYVWKLSGSGDNFGAEIWSWTVNSEVTSKKIWFQPLDFLKVTVGNVGGQSIAFPNFGWWAQTVQNYSYGYQADLTFGNLSATVALEPGAGEYWINPAATNLLGGKIGGTWLAAQYGLGDWGTVQAIATINGTIGAHGFSGWGVKSPLALAVAYNHMPYGQTGFYADAAISFNYEGDKLAFQGVDSQIGGQFVSGALKVMETNLIQYRDEFRFGFEARVEYSLGSVTPYINIDGYGIMDATATPAMTFDLGASTSVGSVSMYAQIEVPVTFSDAYKFSLSVPVRFSVNF